MTPADLIQNICSEYERPDMIYRLQQKFPFCVRSAHSVERFSRDLAEAFILNPTILSGNGSLGGLVQFTTMESLPRCRELRGINLYKSYSEPTPGLIVPEDMIPLISPYVSSAGRASVRDIYGYTIPNTFSQMGNTISLTGVSNETACIGVEYLAFPLTVFTDEDEWETESWIMQDYPELIGAYLGRELAKMSDSRSLISSAESKLVQTRADFIDVYAPLLLRQV